MRINSDNKNIQILFLYQVTTLSMVLPILKEKVADSPLINKTSKLGLFNQHVLGHIAGLYGWKGPTGYTKGKAGHDEGQVQ